MNSLNIKKIITVFCLLVLLITTLTAYPPADDDFLHASGSRLYDDKGNEIWMTGIILPIKWFSPSRTANR